MSGDAPKATGQDQPPTDQQAKPMKDFLIVEYDPATRGFRWKINGNIPHTELVGTLELIKSMIIDGQKAAILEQMQRQQQLKPALIVPGAPPPNGRRFT